MPDENRRTQFLACGLILSAAVCIGIGELHNWIHMIDFANAFGGAGVGILTGQKMTQSTTKGGGDIINPPADPTTKV
jgi:hypothetical protein